TLPAAPLLIHDFLIIKTSANVKISQLFSFVSKFMSAISKMTALITYLGHIARCGAQQVARSCCK
ncbi:MAG: hypothetical protein WBD81_01735, partial [Collimonas pratensis]|uniref:hypothetical protein n=1 Tax=Collimonas pratensis TaxID=279113 RepID=UPI003C70E545